MRVLLRLYPRRWRARYGDELTELLERLRPTPFVLIDLARSAAREHAREIHHYLTEEKPMRLEPAVRHPTAWAVLALLLMTPTAVLVVGSIVGHELGVAAVAGAFDPVVETVGAVGALNLFLVVAPLVALLVAVAPLLEIGVVRASGGRLATFAVHLRWLNLAIALAALLLGIVLFGHHLTEWALEAGR